MTEYKTIDIEGNSIFYREAGSRQNHTLVLLHGWPSSSHMFRDLIPQLAGSFHILAPDYPGFGYSAAPDPSRFVYTFDRLSEIVEQFLVKLGVQKASFYVQDYGGPVGFRLFARRPELVRSIVVQNAIAHLDGVSPALQPLMNYWQDRSGENEQAVRSMLSLETTRFQYLHGASRPERISPDAYSHDQALLDRPGNDRIQLELLYDYRNNPPQMEHWQEYLRSHQPPMLVVWGKNDPFFTPDGAKAYGRDNPNAQIHLREGGHFLLEEDSSWIAEKILARAEQLQAGVR